MLFKWKILIIYEQIQHLKALFNIYIIYIILQMLFQQLMKLQV